MVNSYHGCQSVIEQTNKELKSYWSTPITVVTQPGLYSGIEWQYLGVNSYHSCYSTMIQRAHANGLPFVNSYHSCYSTRESDVTKFINRSTLMLLLNPRIHGNKARGTIESQLLSLLLLNLVIPGRKRVTYTSIVSIPKTPDKIHFRF